MEAARRVGRHGHRDATLIAYRHGLRVSEVVALRWDQLEAFSGKLDAELCAGLTGGSAAQSGRSCGPEELLLPTQDGRTRFRSRVLIVEHSQLRGCRIN
jgi:hypothetical protein